MTDKVWKAQERRIGKMFGAKRTPLSGGKSLHTESDVIHPRLYIEAKYRKKIAILDLFPDIAEKALKENKIPVLAIKSKKLKDDYFLVRAKDLMNVAIELEKYKNLMKEGYKESSKENAEIAEEMFPLMKEIGDD